MARGIPDPKTPAYVRMERRCRHLERTVAARNRALNATVRELRRENAALKTRLALQAETIETLRLQLEELRRIVFGRRLRSEPTPETPADEAAQSVHKPTLRTADSYRRPVPEALAATQTVSYPLEQRPECALPLIDARIVTRYVEDIALPPLDERLSKAVTKELITTAWCPQCCMQRQAKPIPAQRVTLGPQVKTFIHYGTYVLRLSVQQVKDLLQDCYRLAISDGEIVRILQESAAKLEPTYDRLKATIRASPGVHMDETGWAERGMRNYAWVMAPTNSEAAIFDVGQSRGKGNAERLLGDFTGVRVTDCYGAYKNLKGLHQICWAHLVRAARDLAKSTALTPEKQQRCAAFADTLRPLYADLRDALAQTFDVCQRQTLHATFLERIDRLAGRLTTYRQALFPCLTTPAIPADNNKAERKLRHLVLKRKTSFGTKTAKGSRTFTINASVLLSQWWTNRDQWFQTVHRLLNESRA